jgi:predicted flavoprotein YhiN
MTWIVSQSKTWVHSYSPGNVVLSEFVTSAGVAVDQVDHNTMESKLHPNLFFAGEVLNIDGVTGGFNFQNAWSTGWIAAKAIADRC